MWDKLIDKLANPEKPSRITWQEPVDVQEPIQIPKPIKPTVPRLFEFTGDTLKFLNGELKALDEQIAVLTEKRRQSLVAIEAINAANKILGKDESVLNEEVDAFKEVLVAAIDGNI